MLNQDPDKRPSAARILRHRYIKKHIALLLEGTKNRWGGVSTTPQVAQIQTGLQ